MPSLPEITDKNQQTNHDYDVCGVEYSSVERANSDEDEVRDQALSGDPINEVARPPRPHQCQPNEGIAAKPSVASQVRQ